MRTGGAGLFQSSQSLHVAAQRGPLVSIGARGCSIRRGWPSGTTIPWAAARKARLANIAGAVDVDDAAGRRRRCVGGEPADDLGDFVGRGDAAERNVGDDLGAAAALEIVGSHLRPGD